MAYSASSLELFLRMSRVFLYDSHKNLNQGMTSLRSLRSLVLSAET